MANSPVVFRPEINALTLVPLLAVGAQKSQLRQFVAWLDDHELHWTSPHLPIYRDYLITERALLPSSVQAHLSTIRTRYHQILRDRDQLYALISTGTVMERKAFVDELVARLTNAIDPKEAPVKVIRKLDEAEEGGMRLTPKQVDDLLYQVGMSTNAERRDTALIGMMLCTGIRQGEAVALRVDDLYQQMGREAALLVRMGKGAKQRLIPYGDLAWILKIVEAWTTYANITTGYLFRRVLSNGHVSVSRPMTTRTVELIMTKYPVWISETPEKKGAWTTVKPHDLRRTYARNLYDSGMDPIRIMQNLGHAKLETTLRYIGAIHAAQRRPPAMYESPKAILRDIRALAKAETEVE